MMVGYAAAAKRPLSRSILSQSLDSGRRPPVAAADLLLSARANFPTANCQLGKCGQADTVI